MPFIVVSKNVQFFLPKNKAVMTGLVQGLTNQNGLSKSASYVILPNETTPRPISGAIGQIFPIPGSSFSGFLIGVVYAHNATFDETGINPQDIRAGVSTAQLTITITNQAVTDPTQVTAIDPGTVLTGMDDPTPPVGGFPSNPVTTVA